jgi:hypothetical protein
MKRASGSAISTDKMSENEENDEILVNKSLRDDSIL